MAVNKHHHAFHSPLPFHYHLSVLCVKLKSVGPWVFLGFLLLRFYHVLVIFVKRIILPFFELFFSCVSCVSACSTPHPKKSAARQNLQRHCADTVLGSLHLLASDASIAAAAVCYFLHVPSLRVCALALQIMAFACHKVPPTCPC